MASVSYLSLATELSEGQPGWRSHAWYHVDGDDPSTIVTAALSYFLRDFSGCAVHGV
jgi:hypothetical protein